MLARGRRKNRWAKWSCLHRPLPALSRRRHVGTSGSGFGESLSSGTAFLLPPTALGQVMAGGGTAGTATLPAERVVLDRKAAHCAARLRLLMTAPQKAPSGGVEAGGVSRPLGGVKLAPWCQTRLCGPAGAASHRSGPKPPLEPLGEKIMPAPPPVSLVETPPRPYIWERFWRVSIERHRHSPGAHCIWVGRGWRRDGWHRLSAR